MHQRIQNQSNAQTVTDAPPHAELDSFLQDPSEYTFAPVCRWLSGRLLRYFYLRGCDDSSSEELTQDVLFTVYRQAGTLREAENFLGWVYAIARNCLLQRVRFARRRVQLVGFAELPDSRALQSRPADPGNEFGSLIAHLNEEEQEILTLRFVDGLNYQEISAALAIPVGTAKWRVFSSKLKLSKLLRHDS